MRITNATFDTLHAKAQKTPKYLVKFDAEDLETQYTEVDPNSRIAIDGVEITFTALTKNEDAYVYRDVGIDYFDGDFIHQFEVVIDTGAGVGAYAALWALANLVNDMGGIDGASGDALEFHFEEGAGTPVFNLVETDSGDRTNLDTSAQISYDTTYYITIVRDESISTYGTLYAYIYTDADKTTLFDTLSITLKSSKKDFRYIYAINTWNSASGTAVSGTVANLVLGPDYTNHKAAGAHHQKEYLGDIRGAGQRITPEQGRASIGGVTFNLQDYNNEITKRLPSDPYYYHRKKTTIKAGYMGQAESTMLDIMVGWVTDLKLAKDAINYTFGITDPLKWMQRKIFRGAEDTPVTLSGNPINILLQILTSTGDGDNGDYDVYAAANGLGLDEDFINVSAIEATRDDWFPGPSIRMSFTIDKRIQAKKWLETEIYKILNIYPVIDADGKFNIKPFKPPLPATVTVQTFTADNIIGIPTYDFNLKDLINEVECHYDWDGDEFITEDFYIDGTSLNNRGPGKSPLKLEAKGITTALGGSDFFARRKAKVFERYATPPPKISMSTWFSRWLTEAGDIVPVTHPNLPDIENGTRGLTSERMEVINRTIDWKKGKVKIEVLSTGFEKELYCQISPAMTVVSGTSATEFEVSSADAAKFSVGEEIAMHYANGLVQTAAVTILTISGTTVTCDTLGATPAAGWFAQYAAYDSCTADQKLYWFASDGSDFLGAANDPAHLITA